MNHAELSVLICCTILPAWFNQNAALFPVIHLFYSPSFWRGKKNFLFLDTLPRANLNCYASSGSFAVVHGFSLMRIYVFKRLKVSQTIKREFCLWCFAEKCFIGSLNIFTMVKHAIIAKSVFQFWFCRACLFNIIRYNVVLNNLRRYMVWYSYLMPIESVT